MTLLCHITIVLLKKKFRNNRNSFQKKMIAKSYNPSFENPTIKQKEKTKNGDRMRDLASGLCLKRVKGIRYKIQHT